MSNIKLLDKSGKEKSTADFNKDLLALEPNKHLLYLATVMQESNLRSAKAKSLTRTEVRGGGRKPWRQKGTGRARAGSLRSPLFRGGGVIFGPTGNENYKKRLNRKASKKSILSAVLDTINAEALVAVEELPVTEGKTKEMASFFKTLELENKSVLVVIENDATNKDLIKRAISNIPAANLLVTDNLNVRDILIAEKVIVTSAALKEIEERFECFAKKAAA